MMENDVVELVVVMLRLMIMSGGVEELEYFEEILVN